MESRNKNQLTSSTRASSRKHRRKYRKVFMETQKQSSKLVSGLGGKRRTKKTQKNPLLCRQYKQLIVDMGREKRGKETIA